ARPEPAAADFVRIRLARHPVRKVGNTAWVLWRATTGETRDRQIAGTPEEMNRAGLADETRSEDLEHAIGLHEHPPESIRVRGVVRAMRLILRERDRIGDFRWLSRDANLDIEAPQRIHHQRVEGGDRLRTQRNFLAATVTRTKLEPMCGEIKLELERACAVRNRRRGQ